MKAPLKICILADSECLPRGANWGNTAFEATYPYLLDRALRERFGAQAPLVLWKGTRLGTTEDVLHDWFEEVELRRADIVVVQVGGGDCAPRTIYPRARKWIERLLPRFLSAAVFRFEKKYRRQIVQRYPNRRLVPPEAYRGNLQTIRRRAEACGVKALVFINIPEISDDVEHQLPGVRASGVLYNQILEQEAAAPNTHLIRVDKLMRENGGPAALTCDGSHLNARGQQLLSAELLRSLGDTLRCAMTGAGRGVGLGGDGDRVSFAGGAAEVSGVLE